MVVPRWCDWPEQFIIRPLLFFCSKYIPFTNLLSPQVSVTLPIMDIILELWDTFIGDRLYSSLLPASLASSVSFPAFANAANSSLALFGAAEPYVYEQATQMIYLEPSKYAYLSAWPRNNMYRQFTSFFLITWYALDSPNRHFAATLLTQLKQDFWSFGLLRCRITIIHLHLGQDNLQPP